MKSKDKIMKYKCCKCGGINLVSNCPININDEYEEPKNSEIHCEDCETVTDIIDITDEEYYRIKDMSENEYDAYCDKNREEYDKDNKEE